MVSNNSSDGKILGLALFVIQTTGGLVRDRNSRRNAMFALIIGAISFAFAGSTFLREPLNPHEHPVGFLLFWIVCAWLTLAALLLAILDLLMVKLEARRGERGSREEFARSRIDKSGS